MGGRMVVCLRMVEEGDAVEEQVAICDRVVRRHWVVLVCHVVFVPVRRCPWMVVHHHHHVAMRDQVVPGGIPWC